MNPSDPVDLDAPTVAGPSPVPTSLLDARADVYALGVVAVPVLGIIGTSWGLARALSARAEGGP